jgi:hypothetical protein
MSSDFERILEDYERRFRALEKQLDNQSLHEYLHQTALTDYSATSTITGWSAFTIRTIWYIRIGKMVFVNFVLTGTSNSTAVTFTLPFDHLGSGGSVRQVISIRDNTGSYTTGLALLTSGTNTVTCYSTPGTGAWTASGTKEVRGQLWYSR